MIKRQQLIEALLAFLKKDQILELKNTGLILYRCDTPIKRISYLQEPAVCFILRGQKTVYWGQNHLTYGNGQYMCYSIELPITGEVLGTSESYPYVGIQLKLDTTILLQLLIDSGKPFSDKTESSPIQIGIMNEKMTDALYRLANLACYPDDIAVLAPLIQKELYYYLLQSEIGGRLCEIVSLGGQTTRIMQAIAYLKSHFNRPLTMQYLADQANMSVPNFYRHFRHIAAMSPLQYQKSLRLTEAFRLINQEGKSIADAAYQVGYESPSQFSREYKRHFGYPPKETIQRE
ncbi:AraC family transcriptional regulator [Pelistega sp. NLN82]|uniref:AraC family transcriptional regulator n=1 Tax=Pelistega ratti TaxID=2652177 RepID=A0A6L9Y4N1_9BURK|nr:AraC family transcriptional regulator [Pelistega ratti]NEN75420.1 AraC family transcriptional regulator [Pelistega ratti]